MGSGTSKAKKKNKPNTPKIFQPEDGNKIQKLENQKPEFQISSTYESKSKKKVKQNSPETSQPEYGDRSLSMDGKEYESGNHSQYPNKMEDEVKNILPNHYVKIDTIGKRIDKHTDDNLWKQEDTEETDLEKQKSKFQTLSQQQYLNKMEDGTRNILSKHQEKIDTIRKKIEQKGHTEESHWQLEEIQALECKIQELENQKTEFQILSKGHIEKMEKTEGEKSDTIWQNIYSEFQIECNRLNNALPMYSKRTEISTMVQKYKVSVLLGETGSGKSTQIAPYLYQDGLANTGIIVCTQPRKIAAISLATHVAEEMETSVGQLVGYKVGMQAKMSHDTKIVYMTDHILLNECLKDGNLSAYSCIIVDEAHERSIYTDLLLGMVKKCIGKRDDLRVVITSATIDPAVFVEYFGENCPVLSVAGRMFPVEIVWPADDYVNDKYEAMALEKTLQIHNTEKNGDILTFLTSPLEVERCCTSLTKAISKEADFICLPLHGRLQANEQQRVFDPPPIGKRKIVFATNSAETSITIPGIRYVVDTGMAKEMQFDSKRNINTLCVKNVTKSSADQRKGRAGRTQAGKCYRLYSAETYNNMETSSRPEILRVHLGQALLKLMELGVEPLKFDFVQSPPLEMLHDAMDTLMSVGAVRNNIITELGKWIAKLPLDPKFGAFIYGAIFNEDVGIEAIVLSACCGTGGSVFYRSGTDKEKAIADQQKVKFCHEGGDLLTMLNVYREWHIQPENNKGTWCHKNSINSKAIRGIRETVEEVRHVLLKDTGLDLKFKLNPPHEVDQKLQKMLFDTFKQNICRFLGHDKVGYLLIEKRRLVQQFPGSASKMLGLQPDWIVIEQTLKTSNDFAINVTTVENEWVHEAVNEGKLHIDLEHIDKQIVEQIARFEVGEQIYRDFVGIRHSKLKELEEEIKIKNPDTIVFPVASKELGEVDIYAQQNCEHISTMIKERIDSLRQQMKHMKSKQFLSSPNSGVRVILGAGLSINDVLMSDEYKSVIIYGNPRILETKSQKDITQMFERYGQIVKIEEIGKGKNTRDWWKITFGKKDDAIACVRLMTGYDDISARSSINFQNSFRCKLEWCRRPSRGFGFVRFKDPTRAQMSLNASIYVGGKLVKINPSKDNDSEVHVGNLNPNVNENLLRQAFEDVLNVTHDDIKKVTVVRQKVGTNQLVLDSFKQRINREITEYVTNGAFDVDVRHPKDLDYTYLAFVTFSDTEEGLAACRGIDGRFELNNSAVTMTIIFKSSIMIQKVLYTKYSTSIHNLIDAHVNSEETTIRKKQLKNGNVVLDIHTNNVETMTKIKREISMEITGSIMNLESNEDICRLFTRDGREHIRRVMERTDTVILADERRYTIAIHGSEREKQSAIDFLTEYLHELKSGKLKKISLKGSDKPPEIMKELMLRYEFDLNKLKTKTGLKSLELDLRHHIITVIGDTNSVDRCSRTVQEVVESLIETRGIVGLKPLQVRDCVICFCSIEEGEMYRLEICGHSYCKDCVQFQYKSAIQNSEFPIICSSDGCNEPWSWKDISGMSSKTAVPVTELVRKATNAFVSQNNKEYRFCSTADCPLIYRTSENVKLFTCPECQVRICTACHEQFHDGVLCKSLETKKEDDGGLELWMQQNAESAKYCPKCTTPIEKIEGCHHMTCLGCKSHICWMCLEYFTTGQECYGHMQKSHGTFV